MELKVKPGGTQKSLSGDAAEGRKPGRSDRSKLRDSQDEAIKQFRKDSGVIKVLVADAQPLVADSLALALQAYHWDLEVLEQRPLTAAEVLEAVLQERPDVTLIDYWMEMDGPAATRMILNRDPDQKVIVLSWFHGPREVEHSLDAGAVGFLPKSLKVDQVAEGIRRAHDGERPIFADQLEEVLRKIEEGDLDADLVD